MKLADYNIFKSELEQLRKKANLNYDQLAQLLSIPVTMLISKKEKARLGQELIKNIRSIATIYAYGYEVFEDDARFNRWISYPNQSLGRKAPYELLSSDFGREEIKDLIGRIDYGVYS